MPHVTFQSLRQEWSEWTSTKLSLIFSLCQSAGSCVGGHYLLSQHRGSEAGLQTSWRSNQWAASENSEMRWPREESVGRVKGEYRNSLIQPVKAPSILCHDSIHFICLKGINAFIIPHQFKYKQWSKRWSQWQRFDCSNLWNVNVSLRLIQRPYKDMNCLPETKKKTVKICKPDKVLYRWNEEDGCITEASGNPGTCNKW